MNITEALRNPAMNCEYIVVNYDYTGFIATNFVLSLALFFNRMLSKKVGYDHKRIDTMLKIILAVFNTAFFLLQILIEPLQIILAGG